MIRYALALLAATALAQTPAVHSPDIAPGGRVTFRLRAPEAKQVLLTGEFLTGSQPLTKDDAGLWTLTVGPLEPEIYNYNLTVDGVRTIDPANPHVKTGSNPSTTSSLLEVPGPQPAFYDAKPVPHGEVRTLWYPSKSLQTTRRVTVYTPPGYESSGNARFPVLYLLHGANADETAWISLGRANLILDNAIAEGRAKKFIVVMPFGYGSASETALRKGNVPNAELFGRDLFGDVIPLIESNFRVIPDREHRALAGLSMGGMESLQLGLTHLDIFSSVAAFSAGLRKPESQAVYDKISADPAAFNRQLHLLWMGCGTDDNLFPTIKPFADFLDSVNVTHRWVTSPGAHTWIVWRRYLNQLAPLLFTSPER